MDNRIFEFYESIKNLPHEYFQFFTGVSVHDENVKIEFTFSRNCDWGGIYTEITSPMEFERMEYAVKEILHKLFKNRIFKMMKNGDEEVLKIDDWLDDTTKMHLELDTMNRYKERRLHFFLEFVVRTYDTFEKKHTISPNEWKKLMKILQENSVRNS